MLRPTSQPDWSGALAPLVARGVLPGLPPLAGLRNAVSDAVERAPPAGAAAARLFPAAALLAAVELSVESTTAIPAVARPAACLLIGALAMESYAKAHSTKARLMAQPPNNNNNNNPINGVRLQQVAAEELPPLWPYQADVVGMVVFSWGLALTSQLLPRPAGGGGATAAASVATASERYSRLAGPWRGNWLVVSKTGSGKTRMFIEVARALVESRNREASTSASSGAYGGGTSSSGGALVVVLVPQAILTSQHAAEFTAASLPRTQVRAFSGAKKKLSPDAWRGVLVETGRFGPMRATYGMAAAAAYGGGGGWSNTVVVATAESFANLLRQREACMEQLDMLVLDEAHHCYDAHPYAKIMEDFYPKPQRAPTAGGAATAAATSPAANGGIDDGGGLLRPRVLAVTASPASEAEMTRLDLNMSALLRRLGGARLYVVDEQQQVAVGAVGGGGVGGGVGGVGADPVQLEVHVEARAVDRWVMKKLQDFAIKAAEDLGTALRALRPMGQEAMDAHYALINGLDAALRGVRAAMSNPKAKATTQLDTLGQWLAQAKAFAALYGCPQLEGARHLLDGLRKGVELVEDAGLEAGLPYLARKVTELVADEEGAIRNGGGGGGGGALLAAGAARGGGGCSCGDVSVRVSALARDLLVQGGLCVLPEAYGMSYVRCCFTSGWLEANTHPKFWALVEFLQRYRDGAGVCHGIVFVKTRQAVFHVSDMMRRTQQLAHVEVLELVGQNNAAKGGGGGGGGGGLPAAAHHHERHGRGMTDAQQQEVVRLFKDPSGARCKVLVATAAAEEGLDVPSCEFVVRYNAAATGIQLVQSRGRARKRAAVFLAILQADTLDAHLHGKSQEEEATMRAYCQTYNSGRQQ
ncbi:hypothetical protein HYH02_013138 [Chlamydomonas schloesseri]|uniref:Helicase C-terminal domain-containing protein n=1 Tax=Chlamydomonas schloesseri TaxID=2026947 RepID=A0A835SRL2_9CHLO|nr:hypothetical protein HYH02_013138 [Chlamydomonas schloesseri]|eukprot:KAG2431919.1 hypothetical protein HYH02_013138 [Chlamydomonas schloesseri]